MSSYEYTIRRVYESQPADLSPEERAERVANFLFTVRHWHALEDHLEWMAENLDRSAA